MTKPARKYDNRPSVKYEERLRPTITMALQEFAKQLRKDAEEFEKCIPARDAAREAAKKEAAEPKKAATATGATETVKVMLIGPNFPAEQFAEDYRSRADQLDDLAERVQYGDDCDE